MKTQVSGRAREPGQKSQDWPSWVKDIGAINLFSASPPSKRLPCWQGFCFYLFLFCFVFICFSQKAFFHGNICLAMNRKSMVKQASLCWTYRFHKGKLLVYTSSQGKGHRHGLGLVSFQAAFLGPFKSSSAQKGKHCSLASHKLTAILMTRKQSCFPTCLCSSDSRPIETSWWSSLKIIGAIIFPANAAMRASKAQIMTAHIGCTVERLSVIIGNFWLSSTHLIVWGGGMELCRAQRKGTL